MAKFRRKKKNYSAITHNFWHANSINVIKEDALELFRRSLQNHYIKRVKGKNMIS
jgi:hypothetical protein